jgi:hypothetical protein
MSAILTDQEILDLIGDVANYLGLPGPQIPPNTLSSGAAQHPVQPLVATLVGTAPNQSIVLGGPNQRCMLPNLSDGTPNPCTNISSATIPISASSGQTRYDIIEGHTLGDLGAAFAYKKGVPGAPPLDLNNAAVVQIIVPASGPITQADVQVILPSLTFVTAPASGQGSQAGTGVPLMAAVVTAAPFNTPYIPGNAQPLIMPTQNAMPAIQNALTFLGPGGAIYIPSGTYGVGSQVTTIVSKTVGGVNTKNLGQTIIFGGAVSFVALPTIGATPAFEFLAGVTTIGTPTFYDLGSGTASVTGSPINLTGVGSTYVISVTGVVQQITAGSVIITDSQGNLLAGTVTHGSYTPPTGSLTVVSTGEASASGTIGAGATAIQPVTTFFAVVLNGNGLTIDGIVTQNWYDGVQIIGLTDGEIGSLRCLRVTGTGVQFTNMNDIHDNHVKSIYANTPGGGGRCGLDINGPGGTGSPVLNSLKIDHVECLGFGGSTGPVVANPPTVGGICATGVCVRGQKPQSIQFGMLFASSCGIGLYLDAGVQDVAVALLNCSGDGFQTPSGSPHTGFNVACSGTSTNPVANVYIGNARLSRGYGSGLNSRNGIYLQFTQQFHCDYAFVGNRNEDGVHIDGGCQSIGFDHLILQDNGVAGGSSYYGISAVGSPPPAFISIDKLDVSKESAGGGGMNFWPPQSSAMHVSYNDLGTLTLSGAAVSPPGSPFGYYTSDGTGAAGANAFTAGIAGTITQRALTFGNDNGNSNSKQTQIGTTDQTIAGIHGTILKVSDPGDSVGVHKLMLNEVGNLAIAGAYYMGSGAIITSGVGAPSTPLQSGSLYLQTDGTTGARLWVSHGGGGWSAVQNV